MKKNACGYFLIIFVLLLLCPVKVFAFDRIAAVYGYANRYYKNGNDTTYGPTTGNDCARFASQLLVAGNWILNSPYKNGIIPGAETLSEYLDDNANAVNSWSFTSPYSSAFSALRNIGDIVFARSGIWPSYEHTITVSSIPFASFPFAYTAHSASQYDTPSIQMVWYADKLTQGCRRAGKVYQARAG